MTGVEEAARAICKHDCSGGTDYNCGECDAWQNFLGEARACILAYERAREPSEAEILILARQIDRRVFADDAYDCSPQWGFEARRSEAKTRAIAALTAARLTRLSEIDQ